MIGVLTIVRYPKYLGCFGVLSMAIFHLPLWLNKKMSFYKLLGCGKNGTFDKSPDWQQWALLTINNTAINHLPSFIHAYWKFFRCERWTIILEPLEGHGTWDGTTLKML